MPTILDKIIATKHEEIAAAKAAVPLETLQSQAEGAPAPRDFFQALAAPTEISLIAEVKKASPSRGVIRDDFDPVAIATTYQAHRAACISVLTDWRYFQGHIDYLRTIRAAVTIPLLRKDFVIEAYQVWEARAVGADAVLLIAECLDDARLRSLHALTLRLGMTPLVELHDAAHLDRVLAIGARLIGVNNRDLHTFTVDLGRTIELRARIPKDRVVVGESGIFTREDALRLEAAGVAAMLVGESLMREADIGAAVDALLGRAPREAP